MAAQIFDFKKYSKSENLKEFRERFAQSQAFIHFIEEAYQLNKGYSDNPAIAFFNKQLRIMRQKSQNIRNMRQIQDNKIEKFIYN